VCRAPRGCSFIGLRGLLASGVQRVPLDPEGAHVVSGADDTMTLSADEVATLLRAPARVLPSGVSTTFDQLREGLHLWFSAHQPGTRTLAATPADAVVIDQRWTRFVLSWGDHPPAILTV